MANASFCSPPAGDPSCQLHAHAARRACCCTGFSLTLRYSPRRRAPSDAAPTLTTARLALRSAAPRSHSTAPRRARTGFIRATPIPSMPPAIALHSRVPARAHVCRLHLSRFAEEITLSRPLSLTSSRCPSFFYRSSACAEEESSSPTLIRAKSPYSRRASRHAATQEPALPTIRTCRRPGAAFSVGCTACEARRALHGCLQFNRERMSDPRSPLSQRNGAATYLVHKGFPFARARKIATRRFALEKGRAQSLTLEELRAFGPDWPDSCCVALTATLDCHDVIGGTARTRVHQASTCRATHWPLQNACQAEAVHVSA